MKILFKMKATKYLLLILISFAFACTNDDLSNQESEDFQAFLRFNFLVNANNVPLEYPQVTASRIPLSTYDNTSLKTLKIPVALSAKSYESTVTAGYSLQTGLPEGSYSVSPERLSFTASQPTDTLYLSFNERWAAEESLVFELTDVSDAAIHLGSLNDTFPNKSFEVKLGEVTTTYRLNTSRIDLTGQIGEQVSFRVEFPSGYIDSEIDDASLFRSLDGFDYILERSEVTSEYIEYTITLNESLENDDANFQSILSLAELEDYQLSGNSNLLVIKPIKADRDLATNPASHFYDTSNPYFLARGENWIDHDNDGVCTWRAWTAFAVPVKVDANDPNAILGSDNGTPDPSDDIYYDAFKIGFVSPLAGRTTNPFNLQRWFDNESTNADVSPGFNITAAIEFFPEDGTNKTQGTVTIIPQFLAISSRDDKFYEFAISGSGTYRKVNDGLWEIKVALRVNNDELYGGTVTSEYYIYSDRGYEDPADLPGNNCVNEIAL